MLELNEYQNKGLVWYGCKNNDHIAKAKTHYDELDSRLHGGFPTSGIIEVKSMLGIGELRLILPFLADQQGNQNAECVFIAPPIQLNAEFLIANGLELSQTLIIPAYDPVEALWAAEQCLNSGCCSTVVLWQAELSIKQVRRLMLACEQGASSLILIRNSQAKSKGTRVLSLPSALSLSLHAHPMGIKVKIDKQKGGIGSSPFIINMTERWQDFTITNSEQATSREPSNVLAFPNIVNH